MLPSLSRPAATNTKSRRVPLRLSWSIATFLITAASLALWLLAVWGLTVLILSWSVTAFLITAASLALWLLAVWGLIVLVPSGEQPRDQRHTRSH
jgi:hypothetical protein